MNFLLDTCVISDFFKKEPSVIAHFESVMPRQINISTITLMEIEYGLHLKPERQKKIRPIWESLLNCIEVVPFSSSSAEASAAIRAKLKNEGTLIGPYDILIAGCALANNLIMVTSNLKEFKRISEITIQDWRK